jgi:hypothetical protein
VVGATVVGVVVVVVGPTVVVVGAPVVVVGHGLVEQAKPVIHALPEDSP